MEPTRTFDAPPVSKLSLEVLRQVLSLHTPEDYNYTQLHSFTLVSRLWNSAATPLLWRELTFEDAYRFDRCLWTLAKKSPSTHDYGSLVRVIRLRGGGLRISALVIGVLADHCQNVQELMLDAVCPWDAGSVPLEQLAESWRGLTSLAVLNYDRQGYSFDDDDWHRFAQACPPLEQLIFLNSSAAIPSGVLPTLTRRSGKCLRSLVLVHSVLPGPSLPLFHAIAKHCPHLRTLGYKEEEDPELADVMALLTAGCLEVEELKLQLNGVTPAVINSLSRLRGLKRLVVAGEGPQYTATPEGMEAWKQVALNCTQLEAVVLMIGVEEEEIVDKKESDEKQVQQTDHIDGLLFKHFLDNCPHLKSFDILDIPADAAQVAITDDPLLSLPEYASQLNAEDNGKYSFHWKRSLQTV